VFFTHLPYDAAQGGGSSQTAGESGGPAWQRPATPALGLGLASDGPLSWPPGLGAAEDRAQHGAAGDGGAVGDGGAGAPEWAAARDGGAAGDGGGGAAD
jgi:hypothetical protein